MPTRRETLGWIGAGAAVLAHPALTLARAPTEQRLVVVILRGGLDSLHALVPHADPHYARLRPTLAVPPPGQSGGALDLDGHFGLHPALAPLHALYRAGEMLVVPATTTAYRARSHFDAQNILENGGTRPFELRDGWLNRALAGMNGGVRRLGLALGPAVPLILHGDRPISTWADSPLPGVDEDFLGRLAIAYEGDPLFADTLEEARATQVGATDDRAEGGRGRGSAFRTAASVAARLLGADDGARIAVLEAGGWDTHFAQERRLKTLFEQLGAALVTLRDGLGVHWRSTTVVVVSEFGRTVAENGSRGTDHGVGGLALVLGGTLNGATVLGSWPGLSRSALHEGRDLRPTTDYASLFKTILIDRFGLSEGFVQDRVFPASRRAVPMEIPFRRA